MILPQTAKANGGICGQCARNSVEAEDSRRRRKIIETWGKLSTGRLVEIASVIVKYAALDALRLHATESIYGFVIYTDPEDRIVSGARVFTEEWYTSEASERRWPHVYEEAYMVGEWDLENLTRYTQE